MTMCKDEYMSEEAIRDLSHQSKLKHKYEALKWSL